MSEHFTYTELTDSQSHPELVGRNMADARAFEKAVEVHSLHARRDKKSTWCTYEDNQWFS